LTEPVTSQFMVFMYTILTGALAGFLFDIYAGMGQVWRLGKTGVFFGDMVYWLVLTALVYGLILHYNQGEVRFFVLLGLGMGAALYFKLSRRRVRKVVIKTIEMTTFLLKWLGKSMVWLVGVLLLPFRLVYLVVTYPFRLLGLVLGRTGRAVTKLIKRLVPMPVKSFYHRLANRWKRVLAGIKRR